MWLLDERKDMASTREAMKLLLQDGVVNAAEFATEVKGTEGVHQVDTVDLSLGSETIKDLDSYAFALEKGYDNALEKLRLRDTSPTAVKAELASTIYDDDDQMNGRGFVEASETFQIRSGTF